MPARIAPDELKKGQEHLQAQRWREALDQFDAAIAQAPDDPAGYWHHALAARRLGRHDAALADYDNLLRVVGTDAEPMQVRWKAYAFLQRERSEEARKILDALLAQHPNDDGALLLRGQALESLKQVQQAADDFAAVARRSPKSAEAQLRLGNALVRLKRSADGLEAQKRALKLGGLEEGELIYKDTKSGTEFRFVFVPPGPRWFGYNEEQRAAAAAASRQVLFGHNATPLREISLKQGFFILDREITGAQFAALQPPPGEDMAGRFPATPSVGTPKPKKPKKSIFKNSDMAPARPAPAAGNPDGPMSNVTWTEAAACCQSMQQRLKVAIRLPTEVEWECAARSQRDWLYPWEGAENRAWCGQDEKTAAPRPLDPAKSLDVTPSGVFDMAGNVSEWCFDEYRNAALEESSSPLAYTPVAIPKPARMAPPPGRTRPAPRAAPAAKPSAPASVEIIRKTYRGGSYRDSFPNCQSPLRRAMNVAERSPAVGFRPVLLLELAK